MTVLGALQSAARRLIGERPATIFSATGDFEAELADLATEVAVDVMKAHDWQRLKVLNTLTGDGVTTSFPLPSDYDRMLLKGDVHPINSLTWRYQRAEDEDQWLTLQDFNLTSPGAYIIIGGTMQFAPAIPTGETARFYYISNNIATGKAAFTLDSDVFLLPERLLTLGVIWKWKAQKRKDYGEDLKNFEIAQGQEIGRDKGSRIIIVGNQRMSANIQPAYPRALG